jgi:hypothetical protein
MSYASKRTSKTFESASPMITCDWEALRSQLILQWPQISPKDLEKTGPDRHRIALLIERKYGVSSQMVENYIRNFERTIPMAG